MAYGGLVCFGASKMQSLESYAWGMIGAVLGIFPLLVGIFAIVMLREPRVIAGFEEVEGAIDEDEDERTRTKTTRMTTRTRTTTIAPVGREAEPSCYGAERDDLRTHRRRSAGPVPGRARRRPGRLFERYEGPVFRFLFGVLRYHHQAEDALQETFVQALRYADAVDPAIVPRLAVHRRLPAGDAAEAESRRSRARPAGGPGRGRRRTSWSGRGAGRRPAGGDRVAGGVAEQEAGSDPPAGYDGLKFREVAERVGCPLNTALARMHDGMKKLRDLWEARHA